MFPKICSPIMVSGGCFFLGKGVTVQGRQHRTQDLQGTDSFWPKELRDISVWYASQRVKGFSMRYLDSHGKFYLKGGPDHSRAQNCEVDKHSPWLIVGFMEKINKYIYIYIIQKSILHSAYNATSNWGLHLDCSNLSWTLGYGISSLDDSTSYYLSTKDVRNLIFL